ncbi:MAG: DUF362 domain-containing protein, partial [Thermoproteota archaeon]
RFEHVHLALVKPNLCGYYPPSPSLLMAVLKILEESSEKIVVGDTDSAIHNTEEMFQRRGYDRFASDKVELRNLLKDEIRWCRVPHPHAVEKLPLPETAITCDVMVNMPGLGTHGNTLLTCASKNLFGLISSKRKLSEYHPLGVDKVIADICKIITPTVNIVDAGEKLLIGEDLLPLDIVAAQMVGLDPSKVKHLRLIAQDRGLKIDDVKIEVMEI